MPTALHSIRSLLCTATNETPHERFFAHERRSAKGFTMPSWLLTPGRVLMKKNVRASKYDPLVEEVELLEANHHYAHVRYEDGRETTVSTRQLAPKGESPITQKGADGGVLQPILIENQLPDEQVFPAVEAGEPTVHTPAEVSTPNPSILNLSQDSKLQDVPRRSMRESKPTSRLTYSGLGVQK